VNIQQLKQAPPPTLETARLRLTPITEADRAHIFKYLSDGEIRQRMKMETHKTAVQQDLWWEKFKTARQKHEVVQWCAFLKDSNTYVGLITLKEISTANSRAELGYSIAKTQWGKGFGKEAAAIAVEYAFKALELHSLFAIILPYNLPSQRIVKHLGFEQEGLFREEHFYEGQYYDTLYFSLLNPAQRALRAPKQDR
jgi:ribosomal-protein-alanine N-acetyltransferase